MVIKCDYPDLCTGGNATVPCLLGHIGGLCESCDIAGEYWEKSYTK
jgi:hypothetical protein